MAVRCSVYARGQPCEAIQVGRLVVFFACTRRIIESCVRAPDDVVQVRSLVAAEAEASGG